MILRTKAANSLCPQANARFSQAVERASTTTETISTDSFCGETPEIGYSLFVDSASLATGNHSKTGFFSEAYLV